MEEIKLGKYQHYKGDFYEVIALAKHSETLEDLVVYKSLHPDEETGEHKVWVRPKIIFMQNVEMDDQLIPRFKYIDDDKYTYEG